MSTEDIKLLAEKIEALTGRVGELERTMKLVRNVAYVLIGGLVGEGDDQKVCQPDRQRVAGLAFEQAQTQLDQRGRLAGPGRSANHHVAFEAEEPLLFLGPRKFAHAAPLFRRFRRLKRKPESLDSGPLYDRSPDQSRRWE